jgi:hypothetical protein
MSCSAELVTLPPRFLMRSFIEAWLTPGNVPATAIVQPSRGEGGGAGAFLVALRAGGIATGPVVKETECAE